MPQPRRRIPAYELLADEALSDIERQADWILAEIGSEFRGDNVALSLFRDAGASVEGPRVRFDRGHLPSPRRPPVGGCGYAIAENDNEKDSETTTVWSGVWPELVCPAVWRNLPGST